MDRKQLLLIKLIEECSEVQKVVCKSLQFGLNDGHPEKNLTNLDELRNELNDLYAIVEMLYPYIGWKTDYSAVDIKKAKVEHYLEYSKKIGILK